MTANATVTQVSRLLRRSPAVPESVPLDSPGGLTSRGFLALVVTQFLGAFNDNMFRWLIVPIAKYHAGPDNEALALSAGLACLVLPFLIFAAPAGFLSDRFSKRRVMILAKGAELLIMLAGLGAILSGNIYLMFGVMLLMGTQSAIFSPAKMGSIPEMISPQRLGTANGIISLTTVVAIIGGTLAGNYLYHWTQPDGTAPLWLPAVALLGTAVVGLFSSLLIGKLPAAAPQRTFSVNLFRETFRDLALVVRSRPLLLTVTGLAFFWGLASLSQLNVDSFATHVLGGDQKHVGLLLVMLAGGVGMGSVLAAIICRGGIQLGLVPLGAAGMVAGCGLLFFTGDSFAWTCLGLIVLGISAGLFDVPLEAHLQATAPAAKRGSVLAAYNFVSFASMLLIAGIYPLLTGNPGLEVPGLAANQIFLLAGIVTIPVLVAAIWLLPEATIRLVIGSFIRLFYRVRVEGLEKLPSEGGAVIVANHVTFLDGILLTLFVPRPVRMIGYADYLEKPVIRQVARIFGAIPIRPGGGRRSLVESIAQAREALKRGELVCIFPEGALTRTGEMETFKPGVLSILRGTRAPVVPVYLDGLWGSIFSYSGGRAFWKLPRKWPYPIKIVFGEPIPAPEDVNLLSGAVRRLGSEVMELFADKDLNLPRAFVRNCRRSMKRQKVADSTGRKLTGGQMLAGAIVFKRLLEREVLGKDEKYVGLILPPSVGGVLANVALPLSGRIAVNLNYTVSSKIMSSCIRQCGIQHVITSRRVMERLNLEIDAEVVYVEDLIEKVRKTDKLVAGLLAYATPLPILERVLGLEKIQPDDVLTVLFTSGSTGEPKGVTLTHRNVATNVYSIDKVLKLEADDVSIGVLPFFHSYGYTATMWTMLILLPSSVFHFNPLEAQVVGQLCRKFGVTVFMGTPTFLRAYLRRCKPEDFSAMKVLFASAERLPPELTDAFHQKFGIRASEAYGATEMSPLIAFNIPPHMCRGPEQHGSREGSVGRPIPGTLAKVVDPDSGVELGLDEPGMLLVTGPNVMQGYLNRPDLTAQVMRDGWYVTGDIAKIDSDGFIHITGRISRFSKLGGEMVPHITVEEAIREAVGASEEENTVVVTAVPDAKKGERLVVLYTTLSLPPAEICRKLSGDLPNLWIPDPENFCEVAEIPVLGTGKLDLKGIKDLAVERCQVSAGS